jgi:protein-S-isoprenylcysteine O-methyltransferase Ste14
MFRVLCIAVGAVWFIMESRQSLEHRGDAATAEHSSTLVIRLGYLAGIAGALLVARFVPSSSWHVQWLRWVGFALLVAGVSLRLWCFHVLGRYFTFIVQTSSDQPVITSGPYRVVRHPGYAALIIGFVGIGFLFANWLSLIVLVAGVTTGLVYRIMMEERALNQTLGARYASYAATHKRLIPFVW